MTWMKIRQVWSGASSCTSRCTCGEAVRFPDEQREELCEAKSQEGAQPLPP